MAEQDFEKLLATVKQINAEMQTLAEKIAKARQEMAKLDNPAERVAAGRQIGGYQAALVKKSSQATELSAQAMTAIKNQNISSSSMSDPEMEKRINLVTLGVPLTTSEIMKRGRDTAQKVLQEQRQLLQQAQQASVSGRQGPVTIIPGGAPTDKRGIGPQKTRPYPDFNVVPDNAFATKLTESQKLLQEEEALKRSLRFRVETEEKYTRALQQAINLGFSINDLQKVQSRGNAGIEQLQFQRTDASGVSQRYDTFVNPNGRATPGISNQFRSFGQGVLRDVGELTKWSLALAAVYGPLQKLQELTERMIDNQTKLAEATISVNSSFLDQSEIFDIAAEQAQRSGEAIGGVIDAFTQAYRATGGTGNEVERLATAQRLLNDSLILSKLSTLDQASAIDTLSAAVRQTGGDFGKTTELLDSWVRVTKVANVDLTTLATGFAVLGDSAEAAGFDVNELNGLIAVIAESSQSSGKEVANAARAIVGGFQSQQGIEALERLGIATKDTEGNMRSIQEVIKETAGLIESGVINETQLSGLGSSIGGGVRRGAIVTTVLSNYNRALQVSEESARAGGDAQEALAKQLDTVQTSLTRLANAFDSLAQSLGTEGGFLDIITTGVDGITFLVNAFTDLTSILGKTTPALLAFIAASATLKYQGRGGISQVIQGFGSGLVSSEYESRLRGAGQGLSASVPLSFGERTRNWVGTNALGTNATSGAIQGLVVSAIPALLNIFNKDDRYGGAKGVGNIIGGVGGGVIGALSGPQGAIIGATIGTAIADAFVTATIARKTDIFGYAAPTFGEPGKPLDTTGGDLDKNLQQAESELYKSIGFGSEALGKLFTVGIEQAAETFMEKINDAIATQDEGKLNAAFVQLNATASGPQTIQQLAQAGLTQDAIRSAFANRQQIEFDPQYLAFQNASPEAQAQFRAAESARLAEGGTTRDSETAFSQMIEENRKLYSQIVTGVRDASKERLSEERISGDVKGAEYARRTQAISGFDVKALQYYTALGDEVNKLTGGTEDATRQFEILNNVIVSGADEAIPQMTAISGEIQTLINLLDNPELNKDRLTEMFGETDAIDAANEKLNELRSTLANIIEDSNQAVLVGRLDIPDIQGDINKPLIGKEETLVEQRTKQLQDQFYQGFLKLPEDMYNALQDSFDSFAVPVKEFKDAVTGFKEITRTDQQFRQAAIAQLTEEGKLGSQQTNPFGIQQLDITSGQGANLQGTIDYFSKYLATNFPQYEQKPEEFGVIFSDYVTDVLHGDNLAVKLALEKLVDINQKQLDGQYNIPEGATFWVPLTAAYYRPKNEGGIPTGGGAVSDTDNTSALNENTNALRELAVAFKGDLGHAPRLSETLSKIPRTPGFPGDRGYSRQAETNRQLALGFRGDPGYGRTSTEPAQTESFIDRLKSLLQELLQFTGNRPGGYGSGAGPGGTNTGISRPFSSAQAPQAPPVNAKLDFRIDNTTTLMVDGRVLASVITPYLASDLLRLEASQGTITKRYVI